MYVSSHYQITFAGTKFIRVKIKNAHHTLFSPLLSAYGEGCVSPAWVESVLNTVHTQQSCRVVASVLITGLTALLCF